MGDNKAQAREDEYAVIWLIKRVEFSGRLAEPAYFSIVMHEPNTIH